MKYVVQDLCEDDVWDERPVRFETLQSAILEAGNDHKVQIVAIPDGTIVWCSHT